MFIKDNSMKNIINIGIKAYGIIADPLDQNMGGKSLEIGKSVGKPALHKPSLDPYDGGTGFRPAFGRSI